ncbi:MAG: hypothetical protein EZS28_007612, partial [Streblomastix strix]
MMMKMKIKIKTAYKQLPSPINAKFIFNIILSLSSQLVILVALIVVVVLFVDSQQNSTVEIIIAGMRPPTYPQMQYFTLRLIYNYSQINLKEPVQFKYSSSPVWNDSSHIQNNKTRLMQLLKGMSLQLRKIHDNFNYGSCEYTITGDAQIYTMKTIRWETKDNVKFLFEETDCHLKDENLCKDQPEGGQGT